MQVFQFENLQPIANLDQDVLNYLDSNIKANKWEQNFSCITIIRRIIKTHPQYQSDIIDRYNSPILDLVSKGRPQMLKNIFRLVKEIFNLGKDFNVQKSVCAFLPVLIRKSATQIGNIKQLAQQVLTSFSCNCGYDMSFMIASEYSCDKNGVIAQLSLKLLSVLIQSVGPGIMQLNQNTLTSIMKSLSFLIDGNKNNLKLGALDICIFVCGSISSQNYLQLMQYSLKPEQFQRMGEQMQKHRINKHRHMGLKQVIKQRKTQLLNPQFFNQNKFNDNILTYNSQNFGSNCSFL